MTEHSEEEIGDDDFPIFTTNLNHLIDRGYPRGYDSALDAVQEAVAALPWKVAVSFGPIDCDESCQHGPCGCSGVLSPEAWTTGLADVTDAIDALREKT